MEEINTSSDTPKKISRFGMAGLIIGLLALVAAVLSPWIIDAVEPEKKPIDEIALDTAIKIKDRLNAKLKGEEYKSQQEPKSAPSNMSKYYPASVILAGAIAICFGTVGFVRRDNLRLSGATVAVGASAILFQYFLMLAAAIILILLIGMVLAVLQGG
ncbi:MAG: hypothetical protein IID32_04525 [Planctomycetes bacterium]|nr:hypothetical protein [Planctomycetota bacterium]